MGDAQRITQTMISRNLLADLQNVTDRLAQTQQQLSSGKQLDAPSDDPFGASRALLFRATRREQAVPAQRQRGDGLAGRDRHGARRSVNDAVLRARDLLVQGANDTRRRRGPRQRSRPRSTS